jgi:hypothetical protein
MVISRDREVVPTSETVFVELYLTAPCVRYYSCVIMVVLFICVWYVLRHARCDLRLRRSRELSNLLFFSHLEQKQKHRHCRTHTHHHTLPTVVLLCMKGEGGGGRGEGGQKNDGERTGTGAKTENMPGVLFHFIFVGGAGNKLFRARRTWYGACMFGGCWGGR